MTARIITNEGVENVSDAEFHRRAFGHAPRTKQQRLAAWQTSIERFADLIEAGNEYAVPPPCLYAARMLVEGRKRARRMVA